jgi:hypothetical protein
VAASSELVATYDSLRGSIPGLILDLDRVARAFAPAAEGPGTDAKDAGTDIDGPSAGAQ